MEWDMKARGELQEASYIRKKWLAYLNIARNFLQAHTVFRIYPIQPPKNQINNNYEKMSSHLHEKLFLMQVTWHFFSYAHAY